MRLLKFILCLIAGLFPLMVIAQESTVELGSKTIAWDEPFAITLIIKNTQQPNVYSSFPEIKGFRKRDIVLVTSKETVAGKSLTVQRITQNYMAEKQGSFVLNDFVMTVNEKEVEVKGITISVTAPINPNYELLQDSTLAKEISSVATEYANVKDNAFLALSIDKEQVYVGEGFTVSLAIYIADNNPIELVAYKTGEQLIDILKKIKPKNCWEEDFRIREFQSFPVTIKKRKYTQYKIYQATFYPFNTDTVRFGQVGLTMLAKKTGNKKENQQTFYSYPKEVTVKELPPHPLQKGIAVGKFEMEEAISQRYPRTGKGFYYQFKIKGEGNFSAVNVPSPASNAVFDFFPPESKLSLNLTGRKVVGDKVFQIYALPKEPGVYNWRDYFQWIYFNIEKKDYDTLRSQLTLDIKGESLRNLSISSSDLGGIYDRMNTENNELYQLNSKDRVRWSANILIGVMMGITLILILWQQQKPGGNKS
ncbi:hypothetical protein QNI19_23115 [Cytophagaceae bacterium DM2B3-1]|uniref:Oxygen tolerance n=1 Tax=Xanthocytophaga flava TaxID=3048013 RepID=A0ABT7CS84_9BACT|nr:hypothetical protein [Xanthocytophaga flavus]MDJ1495845.1 hypothetical protein [Xanthocytophaga flavus]